MACPDMTVENNVFVGFEQSEKYKTGKGKYGFMRCFQSSHSRVAEERIRFKLSDLEGRWIIIEGCGRGYSRRNGENSRSLNLILQKSACGNAGCNLINGAFQVDDENPSAISFLQVISTMMACPDMEVEGRVLKALNSRSVFWQSWQAEASGCTMLTITW